MAVRQLFLFLIFIGLLAVSLPVQAQDCTPPSGTAANELFTCPGTSGVDVGSGNDTVNVTGTVTGQITSSGGTLTVFVVAPDGKIDAAYEAIVMSNGNIILVGDVTAAWGGLYVSGTGDITSTGNVTGTVTYGIYHAGSGNIASTGNVTGGTFGIFMESNGNITSAGDVTANNGQYDSTYGIWLNGSGNITSTGNINATGIITDDYGILLTGIGTINSTGNVTADEYGIVHYGNGDIFSTGNISAGIYGIHQRDFGSVTNIGNIDSNEGSYDQSIGIFLEGGGNVTSQGDITTEAASQATGIFARNGGTITSTGNVSADGNYSGRGIALFGPGSITSNGNVSGSGTVFAFGILLQGEGDINSIGDVSADGGGSGIGISLNGYGNINSVGNVSGSGGLGATGIDLTGTGNITSTGNVYGTITGIFLSGTGNIVSTGNILADDIGGGGVDGTGIRLQGMGNITSVGNIDADAFGILLTGTGNINSRGNIVADSPNGSYGILLEGLGNIRSEGDITAEASGGESFGIALRGSGNITSNGNVQGSTNGIYLSGDGGISVRGSVYGEGMAIEGGEGNQIIVIDAVVNGGNTTVVNTTNGRDRVNLRDDANVNGDIELGSGDDTAQIGSGSQITGTLYGGEDDETDGDLLIVGDQSYCNEESGTLDYVTGVSNFVGGINLDGDTFDFEGETYSIAEFERGESGVNRRDCIPKIEDGRINAYDIGAWVAGYCNTLDGVNLWSIDVEGNGQADLSVDGATMRAALEQAVSSNIDVIIATGPRGTTLWALGWNQYRFTGPDQREPGKTYAFTFAPGTCGMGNSLEG
jgi:hypothetical protein